MLDLNRLLSSVTTRAAAGIAVAALAAGGAGAVAVVNLTPASSHSTHSHAPSQSAGDEATETESPEASESADASESAVRGYDWRAVGVAHFATHALIDADGQARTALALTPSGGNDGFLTTTEIASLHFSGSLVVLSACQSLGGQILGGEGLRGLAAPLLEAGARAVVVTHWSIGDRSVLPFVDRFYAQMASGKSVGDALRETKLSAIRDGARISDWAAFTVIGDASMRAPLRLRRLSPLEWLHDLVQPTRDTSAARP